MSYEILYRKQFVKVSENEFIPIIEMGSNNCYEAYGRVPKRTRDWQSDVYIGCGKHVVTKEEVFAKIDEVRVDNMQRADENVKQYNDPTWAYSDKRFGWHTAIALYGKGTSGTSFGMFKGFYKIGFEQALTVEQLIEKGVTLQLRVSSYDRETILANGLEVKPDVCFKTTEQLVQVYKEYSEYYNGCKHFYFTFIGDWNLNQLFRERKINNKKATKPKNIIEVNVFYALRCKEAYGFLVKNTKRGYSYSPHPTSGKNFLTEKAANKALDKMRNKSKFEAEKVTLPEGRTIRLCA